MITVYAKTDRDATLYGEFITEKDVELYEESAPDYYQFLIDDAAAYGFELTVDHANNGGIYCSSDTDEERDYMNMLAPGFWEWHQIGAPSYADYTVEANGVVIGTYRALSRRHARDLCAQDAGYESEEDMERRLEQRSDLRAAKKHELEVA